jgi:asparagine synthase (glutamine-hydrolysing)
MCGIAGYTHLKCTLSPGLIERMTRTLSHRGPDHTGVIECDAVSLGATRLRILDLDGGDQPLSNGQVAVCMNGEIYNYRQIRRELEAHGFRFHSHCDTEVALNAFLHWDLDCLRRFRGMFALAFWQPRQKRLLLARDRLGIKPLYYRHIREDLIFGSELKAIFEHPEVERVLDLEGLSHFLSLNWAPQPFTLAAGIRKLPPGHWMEWRNGATRTGCYWRLQSQPRKWSLDEAAEALDALLRDSIREHLLADVPLGIWVSGGVDSTAILHYAAEASSARLKTFSVAFPHRRFDESRWFRQVARHYGSEHHEVSLNPPPDLASVIEKMAWHSDEPGADAGAVPVWFLSQLSRRHVTVALSGEGADELFGGYFTYLADLYARHLRPVPAPLRRAALRLLRFWPVSDEKIGFEYKLKRFLEGSLLPPDEAHFYWNGAFSPEQKARLLLPEFYRAVASPAALLRDDPALDHPLERFLRLDQHFYLPDDILYKCDRMSMAHSLEVRPPFLDHRIAEFAASLPTSFKVQPGRLKVLLKYAFRDKLPPAVLKKRKEGLDIPTHEWFRTVLRDLLLDNINRRAVEQLGLFRWPAVEELLHQHLQRRRNLGYHLWGLLTLFLWMKRWKIQVKPNNADGRSQSLAGELTATS